MDLELFKPAQPLAFRGAAPTSDCIAIRRARNDEYPEAALLYREAMSDNPLIQMFISKVDRSVWLKWMSEQFQETVDGGYGSLLVAQRSDTGELVGLALLIRKTEKNRPTFPTCQFPEGFNEKELLQVNLSGVPFQEKFLAQYGDFICKLHSG